MFLARVTCPHCEADTVATRASFKLGARRVCEHCRKVFVVREIRSLASPKRPRPTKRR
jgi:transposase-like protein